MADPNAQKSPGAQEATSTNTSADSDIDAVPPQVGSDDKETRVDDHDEQGLHGVSSRSTVARVTRPLEARMKQRSADQKFRSMRQAKAVAKKVDQNFILMQNGENASKFWVRGGVVQEANRELFDFTDIQERLTRKQSSDAVRKRIKAITPMLIRQYDSSTVTAARSMMRELREIADDDDKAFLDRTKIGINAILRLAAASDPTTVLDSGNQIKAARCSLGGKTLGPGKATSKTAGSKPRTGRPKSTTDGPRSRKTISDQIDGPPTQVAEQTPTRTEAEQPPVVWLDSPAQPAVEAHNPPATAIEQQAKVDDRSDAEKQALFIAKSIDDNFEFMATYRRVTQCMPSSQVLPENQDDYDRTEAQRRLSERYNGYLGEEMLKQQALRYKTQSRLEAAKSMLQDLKGKNDESDKEFLERTEIGLSPAERQAKVNRR